MKRNQLLFWMLAAVLALTAQVRAATVTATLDPAQIAMGDSSQLTVTVSGAQDQPNVPQVDGLDITAVGQSTQIEVVNGSVTANASNTYTVTPQHEGTFIIPAIHAGGAASQPITLHVGAGSGPANTTAPAQNLPPPNVGPVVQPPQAPGQNPGDTTPAPEGQFGSIQVMLPKKEVFVGELVPVDIKAIIPEDVQASVTDLPQFTSDGFTLNSLSPKPEQTVQAINGRAYNVITWHSALTGVKTGDYPLSLQMPLTVIVQQRMPQPSDPPPISSKASSTTSTARPSSTKPPARNSSRARPSPTSTKSTNAPASTALSPTNSGANSATRPKTPSTTSAGAAITRTKTSTPTSGSSSSPAPRPPPTSSAATKAPPASASPPCTSASAAARSRASANRAGSSGAASTSTATNSSSTPASPKSSSSPRPRPTTAGNSPPRPGPSCTPSSRASRATK